MKGTEMQEYFKIQEVAAALKVTARTLYGWNRAGKITFTRFGKGSMRISREELERFIAAGTPAMEQNVETNPAAAER